MDRAVVASVAVVVALGPSDCGMADRLRQHS